MLFLKTIKTRHKQKKMTCEIEITELDLRYEGLRLKNREQEARLLPSIAERGIEDPLEGADTGDNRVLLNGFKRYRCAKKLGITTVPYTALGEDETSGIVALLRENGKKRLHILEEAIFIDEIRTSHSLSVAEIGEMLSRSKGWVSMRMGMMDEMSAKIRRILFSGAFPAYAYIYDLRPLMRMNKICVEEIEGFIESVSGKKLSIREIKLLVHGYFCGSDLLRKQIRTGNIHLPLKELQQADRNSKGGCNSIEKGLLKDLENLDKYMTRVMMKGHDQRIKSREFYVQGNILAGSILSRSETLIESLRSIYDRSGQT